MQVKPKAFADRLRKARDLRGKKNSEIATAIGASPSAITQWLDGTTKTYRAELVVRAARFLSVRVEWLLFGEEPMDDGESERAAAELIGDLPEEAKNKTLDFLTFDLMRSIADSPEKLGHYLKLIDKLRGSKK